MSTLSQLNAILNQLHFLNEVRKDLIRELDEEYHALIIVEKVLLRQRMYHIQQGNDRLATKVTASLQKVAISIAEIEASWQLKRVAYAMKETVTSWLEKNSTPPLGGTPCMVQYAGTWIVYVPSTDDWSRPMQTLTDLGWVVTYSTLQRAL